MTRRPVRHKYWDQLRSLGGAAVLAVLLRVFIVEPFNIPSGSMIPSLLVGDYLLVSRFIYGYSRFSVPFGYAFLDTPGRFAQLQTPEQGAVVVFRLGSNPKIDYVKRVIGLPGDTVQLKEGVVYINGKPAPLKKIGPYRARAEEGGAEVQATLYEETLPNGVKHFIIKHEDFGEAPLDNTPVYQVPAGHYFVMGDNRDHSLDSRVQHAVGYIPNDYLIGRAEVLFFSTDGRGPWYMPWNWPFAIRWGRFPRLIN